MHKKPSCSRFLGSALGSACFVFPLFIRQLFQRPINKLVFIISLLFVLTWLVVVVVVVIYFKRNVKYFLEKIKEIRLKK